MVFIFHNWFATLDQIITNLISMNALNMCVTDSWIRGMRLTKFITNNIQKKIKKHSHITPSLVSLHCLPMRYPCQQKIFMHAFKCLCGSAPSYLRDLVHVHQPIWSLRSEDCSFLIEHRIRTKTYGERRFDKAAAILWNNLPGTLKNERSLCCLKRSLKTHLFRFAYQDF